jgi:hypothetical protein
LNWRDNAAPAIKFHEFEPEHGPERETGVNQVGMKNRAEKDQNKHRAASITLRGIS